MLAERLLELDAQPEPRRERARPPHEAQHTGVAALAEPQPIA